MRPQVGSVAVTGANGYIGETLCRLLLGRGIAVRALARRLPSVEGVDHIHYELSAPLGEGSLQGVVAVVHAAAETQRGANPDAELELAALERLLDASQQVQARFILVSSQTARANAPTSYGRLKSRAEEMVLARGGVVVRPGQVYGGEEKGLWAALARIARRAIVLPRFLPEPAVQPIHVEDLAQALFRLTQDVNLPSRIYAIADPSPVAFSDFLADVALFRFGRLPMRLPIPAALIILPLRLLRLTKTTPAFALRLLSLFDLPPLDSAADLAALGVESRPFRLGVVRRPSNRSALLREGRVLLRYLIGGRPDRWVIRRYARAAERMNLGKPLLIPRPVLRWPFLLMLFDHPAVRMRAGPDDPLTERTDLALFLAESSPYHADRFLLAPLRMRRTAQIAGIGVGAACEAVARLIYLLASRWIDRIRPRIATDMRNGA